MVMYFFIRGKEQLSLRAEIFFSFVVIAIIHQ